MARPISGTPAPQWWKHLRDWKRPFWKKHRQRTRAEALKNWRENRE